MMMQAQGLLRLMGSADVIKNAMRDHDLLLVAHGPFTAAGVGDVLGCSVKCINRDFYSFAGLVAALQHAFAQKHTICN